MIDLLHHVPIGAGPAKVYASIATQAGMQGWWTRDTTMMPYVGGRAEFGFDKRGMVFRMVIDELRPATAVFRRSQSAVDRVTRSILRVYWQEV